MNEHSDAQQEHTWMLVVFPCAATRNKSPICVRADATVTESFLGEVTFNVLSLAFVLLDMLLCSCIFAVACVPDFFPRVSLSFVVAGNLGSNATKSWITVKIFILLFI